MDGGLTGTCPAGRGTIGSQTGGYAFGIGQNASGIADNDGVGRTEAGGYWGRRNE